MHTRTAATKLGDTAYEEYLDEEIFRLSDFQLTRLAASRTIGPSLNAVARLHHNLKKLGIRNTERLFNLGIGDFAATEGVGLRQLEVACVILDARGWDVDVWIKNFEGKSWKTRAEAAVKKGAKRKARDRKKR